MLIVTDRANVVALQESFRGLEVMKSAQTTNGCSRPSLLWTLYPLLLLVILCLAFAALAAIFNKLRGGNEDPAEWIGIIIFLNFPLIILPITSWVFARSQIKDNERHGTSVPPTNIKWAMWGSMLAVLLPNLIAVDALFALADPNASNRGVQFVFALQFILTSIFSLVGWSAGRGIRPMILWWRDNWRLVLFD